MADSTRLKFVFPAREDDEPWVVNQTVFNILTNHLQPNNIAPPSEAAKEIDKLFPLNRPRQGDAENESPDNFLLEMWFIVIDVAEQIPWNHPAQDKLVDIIQALSDLPESQVIDFGDFGELNVWSDLPLLGVPMTEHGHDIDLNSTSEYQQLIRNRQQSFVAFSARLAHRDIAERSEHFAIYYFGQALEQEPDPRATAYHQQGPRLNTYVPVAAIWILLSGNTIYSHCLAKRKGQGAPGKNWKGPGGYSIERWEFWKKRFGQIKVHDQASKEARDLALQAEDAMNTLEAGAA